jgi:hypothetical protein
MRDKIKTSVLQTILKTACKGTSVTTRELLKELTTDDLADIRNGDMTTDDIVSLVLELADNKDNIKLYRVKVKNTESNNSPSSIF